MLFAGPLVEATLLKRYKRFLADARLTTGEVVTAHCPNSGAMTSCGEPGRPVLLTDHGPAAGRKLRFTLEAIHMGACWVGVNTHRPNHVVAEAVAGAEIPELAGYARLAREVVYGPERRSRVDLMLSGHPGRPDCYVEIKNSTMLVDGGGVRFPDAVTGRGKKHLEDLAWAVRQGFRGVIFFFVGRSDGHWFGPADEVDPAYARTLRDVAAAGVEVLAYRARVCPRGGVRLQARIDDVRLGA